MPGRLLAGQIVVGNALQIVAASSQYAGLTNFSSVQSNVSFGCWYKPTSIGNRQDIFHNGKNDGQEGYMLYIDSAGVFKMDLIFTATGSSGITLSAGTWYHLVVARGGTGTGWQMYVNGVAQGTPITNDQNTATTFLTIGAERSGAGAASNFANGLIDDLRIYERQLSAAEILAWYTHSTAPNSTNDISSANLVAWWKLDETGGTTAVDSSGNSRTATLVNTPTYITGQVQISNVPARSSAGARTLA